MGAYEEQGNAAPTDIEVTFNSDITSDARPGTVVATLAAQDENSDDTFTYELVDDADGLFEIRGNELVLTQRPAAGDYEITIRATDSGDASVEKKVTVRIASPDAAQYETPAITAIGIDSEGDVVVAWQTADPAKEYIVEYRVKGASQWQSTSALTGDFGKLSGANFKPGDQVEARIKAATSSSKNESEWSAIESATLDAPQPSYNTSVSSREVGAYRQATIEIVANASPYAYWAIDWQDGSPIQSITGLSLSQRFDHLYTTPGVYTPVLYVDNEEGVALTAVVVSANSGQSSAVVETSAAVADASNVAVETQNVFSAVEPVTTSGALFVGKTTQFVAAAPVEDKVEWNAIGASLAVEREIIATDALVVNAGEREVAQRARNAARDEAFAELADAIEYGEIDAATSALPVEACDAIFEDGFLGELFED